MVIKTREKLIDAARQLFTRKGIENTTMNDIATASDKGRRTIYTYFKNKLEIYNAVIERESEQQVSRLRDIVELETDPLDKLEKYLKLRFEIIRNAVVRHDSLLSFFSREGKRVDRIRKLASAKESDILNKILEDGVAKKVFKPEQAKLAPVLIDTLLHGVDFLFFRDNPDSIDLDETQTLDFTVKFIINGIKL